MREIRDRWTIAIPGFLMVLLVFIAGVLLFHNFLPFLEQLFSDQGIDARDFGLSASPVGILIFFLFFILPGFVVIKPNQALVLVFFGSYLGTVRRSGFYWVIPFTSRQKISLRVINFSTNTIKVNDRSGNPIEIAAVVVWRVKDAARAVLNVDDYHDFVSVQSETAVRALASRFPYDSDEGTESLRGSPDLVSADLLEELSQRLMVAGVEVMEARLSHLAYAPEIASAMLRRQQAEAVVRARRIITENAVDIVDQAMSELEKRDVVSLDSAERARLVNNLLVALVSERDTQPVLDLGP